MPVCYKLNVVAEARGGVSGWGQLGPIIVTILWSEIMGGYNTPYPMVEIGA